MDYVGDGSLCLIGILRGQVSEREDLIFLRLKD